jgi:hypothetical protein
MVWSKKPKPVVDNPQELLKPSQAIDYEPGGYFGDFHYLGHGRPPFTAATIAAMLTDPRVIYGLWLIKGPLLSDAHVKVNCEQNEQIRQFVIAQINRFWQNSATKALKAIEWGYSTAEVIYREKDGQVQFDELRDFHSPDIRVLAKEGTIVGIEVRNRRAPAKGKIYIGIPKAFVHLHWREKQRYYGVSRLHGAHVPWWEIWTEGGYRDIRRLWFYKNAFEGGTMRHPPGKSATESGEARSNRDLARELIEKKRSGGVLTLPNTLAGERGEYAWLYEPPTANPAPEGLLEYGEVLRDEILEALGIPPEIVSSGGDQGFGSSTGRQVPQMAFYAILQELLQWLIADLNTCIIKPLVDLNFGEGSSELYELLPFKLSEDLSQPNQQGGGDFNGNQFEDENQRGFGEMPGMGDDNTMMAFTNPSSPERHFRRGRRWWTRHKSGMVLPMGTAI